MVLELTVPGADALRAAQPEIDRFNAELREVLGDDGFMRRGDRHAPARALGALGRPALGTCHVDPVEAVVALGVEMRGPAESRTFRHAL